MGRRFEALRYSSFLMAQLRLFAQARVAAGRSADDVPGDTVGAVLSCAVSRYGSGFEQVLDTATVWLNGERAVESEPVTVGDEVAVLPPVSGGS